MSRWRTDVVLYALSPGLLPCGLVASAAHVACLWLAVAPLLAEALHGSGRRWTSDVVFAAAAAGAAMTRAAFGAAVQHLMERWQEGGDAGEYRNNQLGWLSIVSAVIFDRAAAHGALAGRQRCSRACP